MSKCQELETRDGYLVAEILAENAQMLELCRANEDELIAHIDALETENARLRIALQNIADGSYTLMTDEDGARLHPKAFAREVLATRDEGGE